MSAVTEMLAAKFGAAGSPEGAPTEEVPLPPPEEAGPSDPVEMAMGDWLAASQANDAAGMATAFRAAFAAMEAVPHAEAGAEG